MNHWRAVWMRQPVLGLLLVALLLPTLVGCASKPARPAAPVLAAIVVDGTRLAAPGEPGLVSVWRDGRRLEGTAGMALRTGDRIDTGPAATAVLHWPDGNALYVRPNSSGVMGSFTKAIGVMFAKVRSAFAVETQYVRAGTLSTQYLVRTGAGGATTVLVLEGRVQVSSLFGAWAPVVVETGTGVVAHPQAPQALRGSAEEIARTRDWVQQVERLVPEPAPTRTGSSTSSSTGKALAIGAAAVAAALILASRDRDKPATAPAASGTAATPPVQGTSGADRPAGSGAQSGTGTGRAALPAGQVARATPPTRAALLMAPTGTRPGTADERNAPALVCHDALQLDWSPVAGARDYLAVVELRNARGAWVGIGQTSNASTRAGTPARLDGLLRWRVQARQGDAAGPFSPWLHISCAQSRLR